MLQRIPPCITLHRNLVLRHSSTKRKRMYLARKVRLMNTASSAPGGPARCRSNSQAATLQSSSPAFRISKIPTTPLHFPALVQLFLQMIYSYYGVFAWKASHSQHYNHTPELSRSRGQHRCITRLGGWTQINIKERNSVIMCVIVGDVPNNSGYMLRFTQEHACLRVSTKPVEMPEDSIIDVVTNYFFSKKMRFFEQK